MNTAGVGTVVALSISLTTTAWGYESPEALGLALEEAFQQRKVDLLASVLSADFGHSASCGLVSRDEELRLMAIIFDDRERFDVFRGRVTSVESTSLFFEFGVRFLGEDPISEEVSTSDLLRLVNVAGEWRVRDWIEVYQDRSEMCGAGTSWTEARSRWVEHVATSVSEDRSFGSLKRQHRRLIVK